MRLAPRGGERIDRGKAVSFTFAGWKITGFEGTVGYIASKGSVALDGISLTVNDVDQTRFGINLIPHTLTHTTWGAKKPGDTANLEIDVLARYVLRAMELKS